MNRPLADDGQPKPYQVRLALTALLGTLEPGQPLPPERVLAADFGVSRSTVRHAITDMVAAGLVQRLHGSGTYPVPPKVELPLRLASYTRDNAWVEFAEARKGRLKEGFLADLVLLDGDIEAVPTDAIRELKVRSTIRDGKVTYAG